MTGTYRAARPVDECDIWFIAISKDEYIEHCCEHSAPKVRIVEETVVDESSDPDCAEAKGSDGGGVTPAQSDVSRRECPSVETVTCHVRCECEHGSPDGYDERNR
jgi:hypothetical protein